MTKETGTIPATFERIYLLGTGLIGGSLVMDLRAMDRVGTVIGSDIDESRQAQALRLGIIDEAAPLDDEVLEGCDLIVLAVPVLEIGRLLEGGFPDGSLVTDVGSVKRTAVEAYERALRRGSRFRYVPGHPIAGDEKSGPEAARTGLFEGARVILTPVKVDPPIGTFEADLQRVRGMWESTGASTRLMDPARHDRVYAWVSHMPHMAAYAIIGALLREDPDLVDLSGGGLRDYTRIAASSPRMWADIAVANREQLILATRGFRGSVDEIIAALEEGDRDRLEEIFKPVADARRGGP